MTPGQRCDEIIRLIDDAIGERRPADAPAAGASPARDAARRGDGFGAGRSER